MTQATYEEFEARLLACETTNEIEALLAEAGRVEKAEHTDDPLAIGRYQDLLDSGAMLRTRLRPRKA